MPDASCVIQLGMEELTSVEVNRVYIFGRPLTDWFHNIYFPNPGAASDNAREPKRKCR